MTKIEITQDMIFDGKEGDCEFCPVALALDKATGKSWAVTNYFCIESDHGMPSDLTKKIMFPRAVVDWIFAFDSGGHVKPFSFELEI